MTITINNNDITRTLTESVNADDIKISNTTASEKKIFYCNVDDDLIKISSNINSYEDACKVLYTTPKKDPSSKVKIKTIIKAANFLDNNGKVWREDWGDKAQPKYYPAFDYRAGGWVVCYSGYHAVGGFGSYFKKEKTCTLIAKKFLPLYIDYIENEEID